MRARRACAGVCIARLDVAADSLRFEIAARTFLDRKIIQDFAQVTGFRARIGDHLLAVAVIQLLRHRKRLVRGPAPTLAAGFLQGWEIRRGGACRFSSIETPSGPRCPAAAFAIASARTRSLIRILAEGAWRISKLPLLVWGTILVAYLVVMERTLPAVFQSTTDQERLVPPRETWPSVILQSEFYLLTGLLSSQHFSQSL
jgi:hypothetical protein